MDIQWFRYRVERFMEEVQEIFLMMGVWEYPSNLGTMVVG
jgi:hypothetical protein